jgi:hypothetical protein
MDTKNNINILVKQVFTFGFGQAHENHYCVIYGKDKQECREIMVARFGLKWSMQYDSEADAGVKEFNLKKL